MVHDYTVLILVILGIVGGVGFWKLIRHFNYELHFWESLLFLIPVLVLVIFCLVDFDLIHVVNPDFRFGMGIITYFGAILIIYYIARSVKLKKYVPMKIIILYIVIGVVSWQILSMAISASHMGGWGALGLFVYCSMYYVAYVGALCVINLVIWIVNCIRQEKKSFRNVKYQINKISYLNILIMLMLIGAVFGVKQYNDRNYQRMLEDQKEVVVEFLREKYPDYEFEIERSYDVEVDCTEWCSTSVIRNEVVDRLTGQQFYVDVRIDSLEVYKFREE